MDIATLLGLFGGLGIIVAAIIVGGSAGQFVNIPSILVVGNPAHHGGFGIDGC